MAERECVLRGGDERGVHRLLDHGQQRGRGLVEHLGRVFQPERGLQHRGCHQQVPCLFAEAIEPPLCEVVNPLRQPGRRQHGASAGDAHGVIIAEAADQLGHKRGVARGTTGQAGQGLVWRRAERIGEHGRHRVLVQRGHGDPGGTVLLQLTEQVVRGALGRG